MSGARPKPVRFPSDRVESWKGIAAYLRRDLRTVQRWEKSCGLPVRRSPSGAVYAFTADLDEWQSGPARVELEGKEQPETVDSVGAALPEPDQVVSSRRWWLAGASILILVAISAGGWRLTRNRGGDGQVAVTPLTSNGPNEAVVAAAISPNGQWFVWSDSGGTHLRSLVDGRTRTVRTPPDLDPRRLAWFPDDRRILISGLAGSAKRSEAWLIDTAGTTPQMVRSDAQDAIPAPDGSKILFRNPEGTELWVMGPKGEQPRRVTGGTRWAIPTAFWSPSGCCVMLQRREGPAEPTGPVIFRFETLNIESGDPLSSVPDFQVASGWSTQDGRVFAVTVDSDLKYSVWEVKTDLASGAFLGAPRRLLNLNHTEGLSLNATASGDKLLLLRTREQADTYAADFDPERRKVTNVRRATFTGLENYPHAWTPDLKGIVFESLWETYDLYLQRLDQSTPQLLVATPEQEVMAEMAPNGDSVLYVSIRKIRDKPIKRLLRIRLDGGNPEPLPIGGPLDEFRCAKQPGKRCVLRTTVNRESFIFSDLDPFAGKGRDLARTAWTNSNVGDWALSADGGTVAIPYHGGTVGRVRLVSLNQPGERELTIPDLPSLRGVVWDASGQGLLASVNVRPLGTEFYWVDLAGRSQFLYRTTSASWPVLSPDGRRLAFVDRTKDKNAWLLEWR